MLSTTSAAPHGPHHTVHTCLTSPAAVSVLPVFTKKPVDIAVRAGQAAKLQCSATGHPVPVIKWQKDSDDFPAARERRMYVLPDDDQFFIASTRAADSGVYTCLAENEAGVITADASVTILGQCPAAIPTTQRRCDAWKRLTC